MGTKFKKNEKRPVGAKYWYEGNFSSLKRPTKDPAKKAYQSWVDQRARCNNPNIDCYKYYGAKGIQVKYSSREFVGWWLEELKSFKGKKPTVSRINHDGHYEFGNIKLEDHFDNCVTDVFERCGAPSGGENKPIIIYDYKTMEPLMIAKNGHQASRLTEVARTNVSAICLGRPKKKSGKGYTFRFANEQVE